MTVALPVHRRQILSFAFYGGFVMAAPFIASADQTKEILDGVAVEDAVATAAPSGGVSEVRFRLDNASGRTLRLRGVKSKLAGSAALVMRMPETGPTDVESLTVLDQETLDLRSSHIWIELRDLTLPLDANDVVGFELVFDKGVVHAVAHVH